MTKICTCYMKGGAGIGICMKCGGETCSFFGCFISDLTHECNNSNLMKR